MYSTAERVHGLKCNFVLYFSAVADFKSDLKSFIGGESTMEFNGCYGKKFYNTLSLRTEVACSF